MHGAPRLLLHLMALSTAAGKLRKATGPRQLWTWYDASDPLSVLGTLPRPRGQGQEVQSACGGGGGGGDYGFMCPHMMLFSNDMLAAAAYDNKSDFLYGVAGGPSDGDCGSCYQVQLSKPDNEVSGKLPQLVLQVVNSGFDVSPGQFDVFVGAGGMGYFTAANIDCQSAYCQGGPCKQGMYNGTFADWTDSTNADQNKCYAGGIRYFGDDVDKLDYLCHRLSAFGIEYKDLALLDSCKRSNQRLLHQNFGETFSTRVKCPPGLYMASGLRRNDDENYPEASLDNELRTQCSGKICMSTMMDNCKPSCAWPGKGNPDPAWGKIDTCNIDGMIFNY